jgi:hypothetical protein
MDCTFGFAPGTLGFISYGPETLWQSCGLLNFLLWNSCITIKERLQFAFHFVRADTEVQGW